MPKQDARKLSPEGQEDLRRRVMAAVDGRHGSDGGGSHVRRDAAVDPQLGECRRGTRRRGAEGAPARTQPGGRSLAPHQRASLVRSITAGCPDQLRLPFALWTRDAVIELAQRRFGIVLSRPTMGRYLREWGMSPQKPVRRAYERDPAAVRRWLEEEYPAIYAKARLQKAEIHWADEMGLRSDHQTGTSWSKRGVTPTIPGTGQRFGCNMISTVTNRGSLAFMVFMERFTASVMLRFLRRLVGQVGRKVFLVVDGHPVHRSAQVRRWVASNSKSIEMFHLPPYSPDLNPDEFLNNDVKSNAVGRRRSADRKELLADVRSYLRTTQRQPEIVQQYFHAKSVRYAA